jgi:glycosyltransferase involved in cell wall biosynthesis
MNIAFLLRRVDTPGGAEHSLFTLMEQLSEHHRTKVFGFGSEARSTDEEVIISDVSEDFSGAPPYQSARFFKAYRHLRDPLETFQPDLIMAQHEPAIAGTAVGADMVTFYRDYEYLFQSPQTLTEGMLYPLNLVNKRIVSKIIRNSTVRLGASEYIADRYQPVWGERFDTVHPFIETEAFRVEKTGDCILHINPRVPKGVLITLEVAKRLPHEEFLLVGKEPDSPRVLELANELPNVTFCGYVEDMTDIYSRTKLVLMPSQWAEPFGRIPIEAGISGIPTISSGNGGLSEASPSDELVVDSSSPEDYVRKIEEVLDHYNQYSELALSHAHDHRIDSRMDQFYTILDSYQIDLRPTDLKPSA